MGVQWKYLWPVLVLAAALTLGLGAALRFLRPASLGERISVAASTSTGQRYFHCTPTSYTSPQMAAVSSERGSDWVERSA